MISEKVMSLVGLVLMLLVCFLWSSDRQKINWRTVAVGLGLQFLLAVIFLKTTIGRVAFGGCNSVFISIADAAKEGSSFLFNSLSDGKVPVSDESGARLYWAETGGIVFFQVLPTVLVFAALSALLYHWRIMPLFVRSFGWVMRRCMRVSGAESLCAAANVVVGQTEAPLAVRPYLNRMTRSELMSVLTTGMATITGGVLAAYVSMFADVFPDIGGHLMAASLMSAPAALLLAKMMVPETEVPEENVQLSYGEEPATNSIEAVIQGMAEGIQLVLNIAAALIVFIALVFLTNALWGFVCQGITGLTAWDLSRVDTLEELLGWVFTPVAFLLGVPGAECQYAGSRFAEKLLISDFVAYSSFADTLRAEASSEAVHLSDRTRVILSYALCGFAGIPSAGVILGGLSILAKEKRPILARLILRAVVAATFASFITAIIAGLLI